MQKLLEETHKKIPSLELFKRGFVSGIGWAVGVTIGFVIISSLLIFILQRAGGLPLIGDFLASLVEATLNQLYKRTPLFLQ